ncbi:R3H domain-containing nucleic acid-binding protein [Dermatophilaceae bacterium Soc4.6]
MSDTQYDTHDDQTQQAEQAEPVDDLEQAEQAEQADQAGDAWVSPAQAEDASGGQDSEPTDEPTGEPTVGATDESSDDESTGPRRSANRVSHLEREGEVAADFLETLLDIADLDGDIEVDIEGDRAALSIVDSDEGRVPRRLVGQQGKVLEALQELTRLAVQTATGERSRLMLDVAGHRAERRVVLVAIAQAAIATVKQTGERAALDDMTAFERKVVHDEVASAGLDSESEGVEPHRHIVILPA